MAIKKGDRLILKQGGVDIPVEAASDEKGGMVVIKQRGAFANCSTTDLEPDVSSYDETVQITGNQPDVTNASPQCPTCKDLGRFVPPNWVDTARRVLCVRFRCKNGHTWVQEYQLK